MNERFISVVCSILGITGLAVSILFWVPGIVNRQRLREVLDKRYPLVYIVYFANGPFLVLLALLLFLISRP